MSETPQFKHDCDICTFLGRYEGNEDWGDGGKYDLYVHISGDNDFLTTVLARYGDEGWEYRSGMCFAKDGHPVEEALRRAIERGLLRRGFKYIPKDFTPARQP